MSAPQAAGVDVEALLADGEALLEDLATALREEREALMARSTAALDGAVAHKDAAIARLEAMERQAGGALGEAAFTQWLAALPAARRGGPVERRRRLYDGLRACRHENQVNGAIVRRATQATRHVLGVLTGEQPGSTYGAGGREDTPASQRSLARA
jgi:flagellar biosynthesis/type III secretory pathway chaperone